MEIGFKPIFFLKERSEKMTNKTYDILKWIAALVLPALATLVIALAGIWGLPYGEAIGATITAVDAFLGTILGISSKNYQTGTDETTGE